MDSSPADSNGETPLFPRAALHPAVCAEADAIAGAEDPWCVAFSGGADSLALLLAVAGLWPERRGRLVALHFNHRLRGEASDGDERFCREACAAFGIAIHTGRWAEVPAAGAVSEARAREARHAFFKQEMDALGSRGLWLGHQKDDIAETQLMRLARGSSSAGLAAPRPVQRLADGRVFLRPLLTLTKAEITAALHARGIAWREDATNAGADFFRNRIRRDVLPAWIAAAPNDALDGAALSRGLLEEDDEALEAWLAELTGGGMAAADTGERDGTACARGRAPLDLGVLAGKPCALWRRALRRWEPAGGLARAGFEALLELCMRGTDFERVSVGDGFACMRDGVLAFSASPGGIPPPDDGRAGAGWRWDAGATASLPAQAGCLLLLPDGATLAACKIAIGPDLRRRIFSGEFDPAREVYVSLERIPPPFMVRPWLPGDRYRPLGAPGSAKLHDLFINRKIPAGRRLSLPVACDTHGRIIWVPGLPPADDVKISDNSSVGLRLTYAPGTSTVRP